MALTGAKGAVSRRTGRVVGPGQLLLVVAVLVLVSFAVQVAAVLVVGHPRHLSVAERLRAVGDARGAFIQVLGGVGLIGSLYFTARTFLLSRDAQRHDRLTTAVGQLANENSATARAGGVFGLWLLASEASTYWPVLDQLLAALVRERAPKGTAPGADVQAAIAVIGRRPDRPAGERGGLLDLRQVELTGVDMSGLNLDRLCLDGASLRGVNLGDSTLRRSTFRESDLTDARAIKTDFSDAIMHSAVLIGTDVHRAIFEATDISDCDLGQAKNLVPKQLLAAEGTPRSLPW